MSNLIERLRALGAAERPHIGDEAADRIEKLEAELNEANIRVAAVLDTIYTAEQMYTDFRYLVGRRQIADRKNAESLETKG